MSVEYWDGTGVTVQALKDEIVKLGTEFPDKVVRCIYSTDEGEPVCIVGQAVFNITGKVVDNTQWWGQIHNSMQWVMALGGDYQAPKFGFSDEDYAAFNFVARVQKMQDTFETWGYALASAQDWEAAS